MFATVARARPDARRHLLLGQAELVDELAERTCLLHRVQVGTLEVLDQGELEAVPVVHLADHGGDPLQAGQLGRPEAPLPGDELVAVEQLRHEDRLEHAVLTDALGKALDLGLVGALPRLVRVRTDARERDLARRGRVGRALRDERVDAPAEPLWWRSGRVLMLPTARRGRPALADSSASGPIGLGAPRVGPIQGDRLPVARGLGQADVARDHGIEHGLGEMRPHLDRHFGGQVRPCVVHRENDALHGEVGIQVIAHEVHRSDELGQPLEGVVLALDRDQDRVRRSERIDGQEAERRGAIEEDVVEVLDEGVDEASEPAFALCDRSELDFGAGEARWTRG